MPKVRASIIILRDWSYAARVYAGALVGPRVPVAPVGSAHPVLLIPGVYEPWQFMRPIAARLARAGHPVHVVEPLGYNRGSIADAAALAQRYVNDHGLTNVTIVAHSKGGLIGKHMMLIDDVDGRITTLVAVASPFMGSSLSRYMVDPALRAFRPTERTVAMLIENDRVNARIVSIFGEFDPEIPGGSELAGASNRQLPVSGHFRLLGDPAVLDAVERAVAEENP